MPSPTRHYLPPSKRIKRESVPGPSTGVLNEPSTHDELHIVPEGTLQHIEDVDGPEDIELEEDHCSICLQPISDRTVIPTCSHEFCFDCLLVWTEQSRRCPLCSRDIGEYLIHAIRSKYDFRKHFLAPLRTSPRPQLLPMVRNAGRASARRIHEWGRSQRRQRESEREAADELERAVEKRRWVYRHNLYAKHVASNSYTRYRPFPTPAQFAASQDLISRATIFVRRELRVWEGLDVEFLTTFTISLMKSLDIRSESAVKLLAEFLDMDTECDTNMDAHARRPRANAEHFAHELYCYLRSPFRDLSVYDSVVQYDTPEDLPPPRQYGRNRRWQSSSRSRSPHRSLSPTSPHSQIPSPSHDHDRPLASTGSISRPVRERRRSRRPSPHRESAKLSADITGDRQRPGREKRDGSNGKRAANAADVPLTRDNLTYASTAASRDSKGKGRALDDSTHERLSSGRQDSDNLSIGRSEELDDYVEAPRGDAPSSRRSIDNTETPDETSITLPASSLAAQGNGQEDAKQSNLSHAATESEEMDQRRPRRPARSIWETMQKQLISSAGLRSITDHRSQATEKLLGELSIRGASSSAPRTPQLSSAEHVDDSNALSLLQRLSHPSETSSFRTEQSTIPLQTPDRILTPSSAPRLSQNDPPRMPAPEIMARTRARLAQLKNEHPAISTSPSTRSRSAAEDITGSLFAGKRTGEDLSVNDGELPGPIHDTDSLSPSSESPTITPGTSISFIQEESVSSSSLLRARLLSKLNDEKRLYHRAPHNAEDDKDLPAIVVPRTGTVGSRGGADDFRPQENECQQQQYTASPTVNDIEMTEAKLRSQARVRVRLAAAKRLAGSS